MRVLVSAGARMRVDASGQVWGPKLPYSFWRRYLDVFDEVLLITRAGRGEPGWGQRVDGPGVRVVALPDGNGWLGLLGSLRAASSVPRRHVTVADAVILRLPSPIGYAIRKVLRRKGRPYGLEVVGDPWDAFAPGAWKRSFGGIVRHLATRDLRLACREAVATAYVTRRALQQRYPAGGWTTHYSSIDLQDDWLTSAPRAVRPANGRFTLAFVGSLQLPYKGTAVLLKAAAQCLQRGLDLQMVIIGSGACSGELRELADMVGLHERVRFAGQLPPGEPVRAVLKTADLFVLPSLADGLPKAMIEAMALGLPCIGSTVGGMPELLDAEDLVTPGDVDGLATLMTRVLRDPARLEAMSERNLRTARDYAASELRPRRREFYNYVREATESWERARTRSARQG